MALALKNRLRQFIWSVRRRDEIAILLPHHAVEEDCMITAVTGERSKLAPQVVAALRLCDGTRTVRQVARLSGLSRRAIMALHDKGRVVFWRSALPPAVDACPGRVKSIILSPHLDDAALSMGGCMLRQQPGEVLVVNFFTKSSRTRFRNPASDLVQQVRSAEESLVARMAGASLRMLDMTDALMRGHSADDLFLGRTDHHDAGAMEATQSAIADLARQHPRAHWSLPLSTCKHADHCLVRDAALAALAAEAVGPHQIEFYEDMPYTGQRYTNKAPDFSNLIAGKTLVSRLVPIHEHVEWKWELGRVYWSQLTWRELACVRDYSIRLGHGRAVERLWHEPDGGKPPVAEPALVAASH